MIIVGIDPGKHGGVTILDTYNYRTVHSLSMDHYTKKDIYIYLSEIKGGDIRGRAEKVIREDRQVLKLDDKHDNSMEIWLEDPGQIRTPTANNISKNGKQKEEARLLAGMKATRILANDVGQWQGLGIALSTTVKLVPPKEWQAYFSIVVKGDKNVTKNMAIKLFPLLTNRDGKSKITHSVADSLLIALYGYLQYVPENRVPKIFRNRIQKNDRRRVPRITGPPRPVRRPRTGPKRITRSSQST
jgi:hypothetical protein